MECLYEHCPVIAPRLGLCEECAIEQLEAQGYTFAEAVKIAEIIYGE